MKIKTHSRAILFVTLLLLSSIFHASCVQLSKKVADQLESDLKDESKLEALKKTLAEKFKQKRGVEGSDSSSSSPFSTPKANHRPIKRDLHDRSLWSVEKNDSFIPVPLDMLSMEEGSRRLAEEVTAKINEKVTTRLESLFNHTKTPECRQMISEAYGEYLGAIGGETSLPFSQGLFESECPHKGDKKHSDKDSDGKKIDDPKNLKLLYLILTHKDPNHTIRLISALEDEGHSFVVHVDARESSNPTQTALMDYYKDHPQVHICPDAYRVSVNWGGFSIVQATLNTIKYAFGIGRPGTAFDFHKVISIASTTYPLVSNSAIRKKIASYPLDMNLMEIRPSPNTPAAHTWHYYVECDEKVHRIYRLSRPPNIDMYVGSQWFIISREFAKFLVMEPDESNQITIKNMQWKDKQKHKNKSAKPRTVPDGQIVQKYAEYGQHVVVSDENFFATVMKNSRFCHKHTNQNFLHVQFDDWENNKNKAEERDPTKCLMPNPAHCGRSPTTMTLDYLPILELSGMLFARKFDHAVDENIMDVIDARRAVEEAQPEGFEPDKLFDGADVLIVNRGSLAKRESPPLCMGSSETGGTKGFIYLQPCFNETKGSLPPPGWERTTIDKEITSVSSRWNIGPCSSDGEINFTPGECIDSKKGIYTYPTCSIRGAKSSSHEGKCLDVEGERMDPGGDLLLYPCTGRWNQYFSFGGDQIEGTSCSIYLNIPSHLVKSKKAVGKKQTNNLFLGGREIKGNNYHQPLKTKDCVGEEGKAKNNCSSWDEWIIVPVESAGASEDDGVKKDEL